VSFQVYRHAAFGKTAGLFGMPVEGAALLSGHTEDESRRLAAPFEVLGLAYQMLDDVVDLYGDKGREAPGSDVREGKISALVVEHLAQHPKDRDWLLKILQTPRGETAPETVAAVIERFHAGGTVTRVLEAINREAETARAGAARTGAPGLTRLMDELVELVLAPIRHLWAAKG
jgi:octaprenyl-diphosphate synthase